MASHDYSYRSGYSNGKGAGTHPNEWSKASYTDDECLTVIVDADGTERKIYGCTPFHKPGSYVTQTETIVHERILSPGFPVAYKHSSPATMIEPVKEYRYVDDKWHRASSPPVKSYGYSDDHNKLHRPSSPVKGYGTYAGDDHKLRRPSSPVKGYGTYAADHQNKLHRPSSPVKGYGTYAADDHKLRRPSSPENDYPQEVSDFLTKVQIDGSRDQPSRIGPFNGVNRRQPSQQPGHNGTAGYGDYVDYNNKTFYKPTGNTIREDNYDDYRLKNNSEMLPAIISNGGRQTRPIPTWVPSSGREGRLTSATDDIETALRYLRESAKPTSTTTNTPQYSRYPAVPKNDEYPRDAAKRNVRFNAPSRP